MASQTINGKAFEWAVGLQIANQTGFILQKDQTAINNQTCYLSADITDKKRKHYDLCAQQAIEHIVKKENLLGNGSFRFLPDNQGKEGDVRDVVIEFNGKTMGLSCKTNHEAYKHSRLSKTINFIEKWGLDPNGCSDEYFQTITPIFETLEKIKINNKGTALWRDLKDVPSNYYWPVLDAFHKEVARVQSQRMCEAFLRYLIGNYDFYKIVATTKNVTIQGFNLNGTLNVYKNLLPTKIDFIKNSNGSQYSKTIGFDKGWVFNFRIHNASSRVEPSLKFDVTAVSLPPRLYTHHIDL